MRQNHTVTQELAGATKAMLTGWKTCLTLLQDRHLFLETDVFLFKFGIVLQQTCFSEFIFLNIISQAGPLDLHILVDLEKQTNPQMMATGQLQLNSKILYLLYIFNVH